MATTRTHRLVVEAAGERLDVFLTRRLGGQDGMSRAEAQRLIEGGHVLVDGVPSRASRRLKGGESVEAAIPPPQAVPSLVPQDIPLTIVYQDRDLLVVDKPAGLTVHPAPGHPTGTLVNALLARFPDLPGIGGEVRPGIVHRLDKDTSGLMVVALTERAHRGLVSQFQAKALSFSLNAGDADGNPEDGEAGGPGIEKVYLALVRGHLRRTEGTVDAPIGRHPVHRKKMAVVEGGRRAVTRFRGLRWLGAAPGETATLVEASPETGRTHQIRVHLAHLGHPLVGDGLYGKASAHIGRHALHAHGLGFRHPVTGVRLSLESPLPADMASAVEALAAAGDRPVR